MPAHLPSFGCGADCLQRRHPVDNAIPARPPEQSDITAFAHLHNTRMQQTSQKIANCIHDALTSSVPSKLQPLPGRGRVGSPRCEIPGCPGISDGRLVKIQTHLFELLIIPHFECFSRYPLINEDQPQLVSILSVLISDSDQLTLFILKTYNLARLLATAKY